MMMMMKQLERSLVFNWLKFTNQPSERRRKWIRRAKHEWDSVLRKATVTMMMVKTCLLLTKLRNQGKGNETKRNERTHKKDSDFVVVLFTALVVAFIWGNPPSVSSSSSPDKIRVDDPNQPSPSSKIITLYGKLLSRSWDLPGSFLLGADIVCVVMCTHVDSLQTRCRRDYRECEYIFSMLQILNIFSFS